MVQGRSSKASSFSLRNELMCFWKGREKNGKIPKSETPAAGSGSSGGSIQTKNTRDEQDEIADHILSIVASSSAHGQDVKLGGEGSDLCEGKKQRRELVRRHSGPSGNNDDAKPRATTKWDQRENKENVKNDHSESKQGGSRCSSRGSSSSSARRERRRRTHRSRSRRRRRSEHRNPKKAKKDTRLKTLPSEDTDEEAETKPTRVTRRRKGMWDLLPHEVPGSVLDKNIISGSSHTFRKRREAYVGNLAQDCDSTGKKQAVTDQVLASTFRSMFHRLPEYFQRYPDLPDPVLQISFPEAGKGCFAFVEFRDEAIAGTAVLMNGFELLGRSVKVGRPQGFIATALGEMQPMDVTPLKEIGMLPMINQDIVLKAQAANIEVNRYRELYIGNLEQGMCNEHIIKELFEPVCTQFAEYTKELGPAITKVTFAPSGMFCFVQFQMPEMANKAASIFNGTELFGRKLKVGRPQQLARLEPLPINMEPQQTMPPPPALPPPPPPSDQMPPPPFGQFMPSLPPLDQLPYPPPPNTPPPPSRPMLQQPQPIPDSAIHAGAELAVSSMRNFMI